MPIQQKKPAQRSEEVMPVEDWVIVVLKIHLFSTGKESRVHRCRNKVGFMGCYRGVVIMGSLGGLRGDLIAPTQAETHFYLGERSRQIAAGKVKFITAPYKAVASLKT